MGERLAEAWEPLEIGVRQLDHACRLASDRAVDRPWIKIADLIGREEREAAAAADYAGDIVRLVEVRCDDAGVADPDARRRRFAGDQFERVFALEAGQDLLR